MAYTTINKSTDYFNTKLYTGNGGTQTISGIGHQPDWVWFKPRSSTSHMLQDAVRGTTKFLETNTNAGDQTSSDGISSFNSDGYAIGANGRLNSNGTSMVCWNWKAGGGQGSSNTDGTINTTYTSANTTSGMSIIQYNGNGSAGATIGHGLGVAPKCVIIKRTDTTSNWIFGTGARGFNKFIYLNSTSAETTNSGAFNDTAPSTSVITLGSWNDVNNSSGTYIAYAFAEKQGYSKFDVYKGNYVNDGPFIYTGFKPKFILIRQSNDTGQWRMYDTLRESYGQGDLLKYLASESSAGEVTTTDGGLDILSNGFKIRSSGGNHDLNGNQDPYLYMAFGQTLVGSNNVPCTAR